MRDRLHFGERLSEFLHHRVQRILFLVNLELFLAHFRLVENAADEPAEKRELAVPRRVTMCGRSVTLMSRSARTTGMFFSFAVSTAALSSEPGRIPVCAPMRFWYDPRTRFAMRGGEPVFAG